MGRNKTDRVGERFTNKQGEGFVIVEYNNANDVWVQFEDEHKARVHTQYSNCKKGSPKNPYYPSVHGKGYIGLMSDGSRPITTYGNGKQTREYIVWQSMVHRVYDPKYHEKQPTYKDVILDENLHCFAYFLEHIHLIPNYEYWLTHPNERVALDKDIRGNGSKIYSLDTIMFVTQSENARESVERCGTLTQHIKVYGINVKTGERTKVFNSIKEVERELGVNKGGISHCLNGRHKTAGGYKWYKVEENQ